MKNIIPGIPNNKMQCHIYLGKIFLIKIHSSLAMSIVHFSCFFFKLHTRTITEKTRREYFRAMFANNYNIFSVFKSCNSVGCVQFRMRLVRHQIMLPTGKFRESPLPTAAKQNSGVRARCPHLRVTFRGEQTGPRGVQAASPDPRRLSPYPA